MKSLLLSLSVLALIALGHTIPCVENRCGRYNYMGAPSLGYANANVDNGGNGGGYEVGQESIGGGGAGNEGGGGDEGYNGGGGSGYEGGGGGGEVNNGGGGNGYQGGGGNGYQGGGGNGYQGGGGGGRGYQGGGGNGYQGGGGGGRGYQGGGGGGYYGGGGGYYSSRPRSSYCPNCYVKDFGNGIHNANTINIKHRRN